MENGNQERMSLEGGKSDKEPGGLAFRQLKALGEEVLMPISPIELKKYVADYWDPNGKRKFEFLVEYIPPKLLGLLSLVVVEKGPMAKDEVQKSLSVIGC